MPHLVLRGVAAIEATIDGEVVHVEVPLTVSLQPRAAHRRAGGALTPGR